MQPEIPYDIIAKYLAGECSEKEKELLENWRKEKAENNETFELMKNTWTDIPGPEYSPDVEKALKSVSSRLPEQKKKHTLSSSPWLKIAAAFVLGLGLLGVYNLIWSGPKMIEVITASADFPQEIILPDNSIIILGKNSELKYPSKFKGNTRTIEFTGEAYFDITSNQNKPFIIESEFTTAKVVGTAFNLRSFKKDTLVKITVTEGLVSFKVKNDSEHAEVLVGIGEVGKLNVKTNTISKETNRDKNFMAWQNGKLTFENEKLGTALKTLSIYYGKTFTAIQDLDTTTFNGYFDSMSIKEAAEYMEMVLDVTITEKNNQFVLKPNK